ncbi:MAG: hypothetical protein VKL59_27130 [Nostocaceae cyanobacterium]|nr:hypothetical protein [Nostocaceae cyanobacterium]
MTKSFLQPLDRLAIALMLVLGLIIGLLLSQGDAVTARVRDFSWQGQQVGADDAAFSMTFSRPMDSKSVEENLKIEPPLPGKFSWAGRRMVYTLIAPAPYGINYKLQLQNARDRFAPEGKQKKVMQPFSATFRSRDRVLVYIGVEAEEQGKLILYNLNSQQKKILTPKDLVVLDFKPYPNGQRILFSASQHRGKQPPDIASSQLYSVTTGISDQPETEPDPAGRLDLLLGSKEYQNLKFDLSSDGKTIAVQRVKKDNPADFGLWFFSAIKDSSQEKPQIQRLQTEPTGDFLITPDSQAVAVAQGQGVAILPLQKDGSKPLDFLPQYGMVQAFSKDGSQAVMVKFNTNYTRNLFLVTNQGEQKELLNTTGSILSCQFDVASPTLYCLLTQLLEGEQYQEQPYIAAINLKTGAQRPLVLLPILRDIKMNLSPDGLALIFDQVQTGTNSSNPLRTDDGQDIVSSRLWLLPLFPAAMQQATPVEMKPEELPLPGIQPQWLP